MLSALNMVSIPSTHTWIIHTTGASSDSVVGLAFFITVIGACFGIFLLLVVASWLTRNWRKVGRCCRYFCIEDERSDDTFRDTEDTTQYLQRRHILTTVRYQQPPPNSEISRPVYAENQTHQSQHNNRFILLNSCHNNTAQVQQNHGSTRDTRYFYNIIPSGEPPPPYSEVASSIFTVQDEGNSNQQAHYMLDESIRRHRY